MNYSAVDHAAASAVKGAKRRIDYTGDWPGWAAYAVGAGLLALAQAVRFLMDIPFGSQTGIMFMMPPIVVAAFMGGLLPGLVATAAGLALTSGFLVRPESATMLDQVRLASFLLAGTLTSVVCDALRRARHRTEQDALQHAVTLASIGDGVITTDVHGRITLMNAAAERLTGWSAGEAAGRDLVEVFDISEADTRRKVADPVSRVLESVVSLRLADQTLLRTRDGQERSIDDSAAPIRTPGGALAGVVVVFRDCGERRRHEAELLEQAERYTRLLEISPDAVLVNRGGRIVLANKAALQLFGAASAAELMGRTPLELFHPDCHAFIQGRIEQLRAGFAVPVAEERIVRLDGEVVDVDVVASPFMDRGVLSIHVVLRDITARKEAEQELRQWADCFTHCAHGIGLSHPPTGTLAVCNPAYARMLGYTVEELAGAKIFSIYHPSQHEMLREQMEIAEATGHARYETVMLRKDGSTFPAQMDLVGVHDGHGNLIYRVGTLQDISERKTAENEVQRLTVGLEREVEERTAELRAANQELDAFTYAVSHDLRAPLRAMSGFSQALVEDCASALDGEGRTYLDQIIAASQRMGQLVEGLLVLSRTTRHEVRRESVDLTAIAERLRKDLALGEPGRTVTWSIEPGLAAHGDARMLEILLDNLLSNAWKYTGGRPDAHIRVGVEHGASGPEYFVSDNGAGFSMAHAGKLFQPFQRLHRQDEFPGIGIGLATVQRVVNRHGGTITGWGEPDKGATFRFTLAPVTPPDSEFL
jgi:PAS domain S-box/PAS domain S-box/PAS domain S-box